MVYAYGFGGCTMEPLRILGQLRKSISITSCKVDQINKAKFTRLQVSLSRHL